MNILALETTNWIGSVAAMTEGKLLLELELNPQQRTAQSLPPGIETLLKRVGWKPADVHLVALTIGPGSFTGLRIGVTMAKTFAYSVGAEVLGINTLETIAQSTPANVPTITAVIDAQRGDVVVRPFSRGPEGFFLPVGDQQLISIDRWLQELPAGMAVAGPALAKLASRLPAHITALDEKYWTPRAAMVAQLAHRQYATGRRDDLWTLAPQYSRRSAAEEKWQSRG
ncbi:MAG: tRNA (adenosine(37)-N6)-threonylcarbamoyltransferase complex dimerization subunit type 1 TsaB [Thermoguttaceae bacterium]